jgi:hypothetical protein
MHNQQILYIIKISRVCVYDGQLFMQLKIDVKECIRYCGNFYGFSLKKIIL